MKKNVNVQTTTETKTTTVTTVTTTTTTETTERIPAACYMPIDKQDKGAEDFYKANGIQVKTINLFGSNRVCAIVPHPEYDEAASEEERTAVEDKSKAFSKDINDYRRKRMYHDGKRLAHEGISLNGMMEVGYEPSDSNLDVAITISTRMTEKEEIDKELGADEDKQSDTYTSYVSYTDEDGNTRGKNVCRGGYDSSSDLNNPEYICAKEILYAKLHALINELDGEELAIVQMIMDGASEREYTKEHGIARSTFQGHKNKLLARLREALKDDYED